MRFTSDEMLFFNSLTDGDPLFGIQLDIPAAANEESLSQTVSKLQKKGLIDEDKTLNGKILAPVNCLEKYKSARTYVFINDMRIGLLDENKVAVIFRIKGLYEFLICEKWAFLYLLFSQSPPLNSNLKQKVPDEKTCFEAAEIAALIQEGHYQDESVLQKYVNGRLTQEYILLWHETVFYKFDGKTRMKEQLNGEQGRRLFMDLLEFDSEVMKNGR